jgi:hypothetical protein
MSETYTAAEDIERLTKAANAGSWGTVIPALQTLLADGDVRRTAHIVGAVLYNTPTNSLVRHVIEEAASVARGRLDYPPPGEGHVLPTHRYALLTRER